MTSLTPSLAQLSIVSLNINGTKDKDAVIDGLLSKLN